MGFVQLSDNLVNWEWLEDKNTVYVYIHLLLGAGWSEKDYKGCTLTSRTTDNFTARICRKMPCFTAGIEDNFRPFDSNPQDNPNINPQI